MPPPKNRIPKKSEWLSIEDALEWNDVGGRLLANIAKGIYNHEAVLREYVQNACDAYNMLDVEVESPLIAITSDGNNISIQDFGIGMDEEHIRSVKKVAVSNKDDFEDVVGFRGIGVWAGLQACRQLEIETTKQGVGKKYRLTIDFAAITERFDDNINIKELIDPHYKISVSASDPEDHYTRTTLKGVLPGYEKLLDAGELSRIVSTILPCRLNPKTSYLGDIQAITERAAAYREFVIKVNTVEAYRRFPSQDTHPPLEEIVKNGKGVELARIWYCATKKDSLDIGGFQLRVRNFGVGSQNIFSDTEGHSHGVFDGVQLGGTFKLDWFFGEIHVTNSAIRPNTPRNDLEIDAPARELIAGIRVFYSRRLAEAGARSEYNGFLKALEQGEALIKSGTIDASEALRLNSIIEKLEKAAAKAKKTAKAEKDIVLRDLLKQPGFVKRRKAAIIKLKALIPPAPRPTKPARPTKRGKTPPPGPKKLSTTKEELLSEIIALVEDVIGSDHEDFTGLCESISQVISNYCNGDA